jgi:multidrug resistance protein, MATE family
LPWTVAAPLAGAGCFLLDGFFIGATRTRDMRNMMVLSVAVFLAAWAMLASLFGNHGLWAAMIVFFVVRTIALTVRFGALEKASCSAVLPCSIC